MRVLTKKEAKQIKKLLKTAVLYIFLKSDFQGFIMSDLGFVGIGKVGGYLNKNSKDAVYVSIIRKPLGKNLFYGPAN